MGRYAKNNAVCILLLLYSLLYKSATQHLLNDILKPGLKKENNPNYNLG